MPIAEPIRAVLALAPRDVGRVVQAIGTVARTLASLASEGVFHRDLKPENLYCYDGRWCVGDFGLADYPDKEALTKPGVWLGPLFYIAPELLPNPDSAAPGPADVFSLAKTLWVLGTGQNVPPPGPLSRSTPQLRLSQYCPGGRTAMLDSLIERATEYSPANRPSMQEMADELEAWSRTDVPGFTTGDLSDVAAIFAPLVKEQLDHTDAIKRAGALASAFAVNLKPRLELIRMCAEDATGLRGFSNDFAGGIEDWPSSPYVTNKVSAIARSRVAFGIETFTALGNGRNTLALNGGIYCRIRSQWRADFFGGYALALGAGSYHEIVTRSAELPFESALAERFVEDLVEFLNSELRRALEAFAEEIQRRSARKF